MRSHNQLQDERKPQRGTGKTILLVLAYLTIAWAIPLIISLGRILSSAGQSAFIFPKFMDFIDSWGDSANSTHLDTNTPGLAPTNHSFVTGHNATAVPGQECLEGLGVYAALATVTCNVIVNLATRTPATFAEFRKHYKSLRNKLTGIEEDTSEPDDQHARGYLDFSGLNCTSKMIFALLKPLTLASGGFVGLGTYLSIKSLNEVLEQCIMHLVVAEDNPVLRSAYVEGLAIFFAATSTASYFIYNIKKADNHAHDLAKHLGELSLPTLKWKPLLLTVATSSPATLCVGPMAFFTTAAALEKTGIPMPSCVRYGIAGVSCGTATVGRLLSDVPSVKALFDALFNQSSTTTVSYSPYVSVPYKTIVYGAGIGNSFGTAISNLTGFVGTAKVVGIDGTNVYVATVAGVCAVSSALLDFAFGTYAGAAKGLRFFAKPREIRRTESGFQYQALPSNLDQLDNVTTTLASLDRDLEAARHSSNDIETWQHALEAETPSLPASAFTGLSF